MCKKRNKEVVNKKIDVVREGKRIDGCLCCHEGKQGMREETAGD